MFRYISYLSKAPKQSYCNKFYYNTIPSRTFCLKRTLDLKYIDISDTSNMPVFALGGIKITDLELCKRFNGFGVSGISDFWN